MPIRSFIPFFFLLTAAPLLAQDFFQKLYESAPVITVPPAGVSLPEVDGKISAGEWGDACTVTGFNGFGSKKLLRDGPHVRLLYSPKALFVLFFAPLKAGKDVTALVREQDGAVYKDDAFELYLQPPGKPLYQMVVNALGTAADFRDNDKSWNSALSASGGKGKLPPSWNLPGDFRFVELAVPLADIGVGGIQPGDVWKANFAADRPEGPWASFAPVQQAFSETKAFANVRFLAAGQPYLQITRLPEIMENAVIIEGRCVNPGSGEVKIRADLDLRKKGSYTAEGAWRNVVGAIQAAEKTISVPPRSAASFIFREIPKDASIDRIGLHVADITDAGRAGSLFGHHGAVEIAPRLAARLVNIPSQKYIDLEIDASNLKSSLNGKPARIVWEIQSRKGRRVYAKTLSLWLQDIARKHRFRYRYGPLPVGSYTCRVSAFPASGDRLLAAVEAKFNHLAKPAWWNPEYDRYARSTRILKPWTPIRYAPRSVSVWGRKMIWNKSLLPGQILSQRKSLLDKPIQILVKRGGRTAAVPLERFAFLQKAPHRGAIRAEGRALDIDFTADMFIDYDGFLWVDLRCATRPKAGSIDSLYITVPFKADSARLYQTFNRALAGWIGAKPIQIPWYASKQEHIVDFYHWFGEEERGLGFTYASDKDWRPESRDNICTFVPGRRLHMYRMNLVEKPVRARSLRYQFGIQATPIKPLPPDYHSMAGSTLSYGAWRAWEKMPGNMDILLIWGEPTGTMRGLNDPLHVPDTLKDYLAYPHRRGVAATGPATCPQKFSSYADEFEDYLGEWETLPESILNWNGIPHYQNCGHPESLRRWLFSAWAGNVRRFPMDAIYFDGWQTGQIACANPHHGCGWTDEAGERHVTIPVLEGREFNRALALFLEDHIRSRFIPPETAPARPNFPRYHYWIHSWEFVPSMMGFATLWLTGEFTGYPQRGASMLTPEGSYAKMMDIGFFRARSLSTHWGVPNLFDPLMWEHEEFPKTDRQTRMAFAWFLPHGVPPGLLEYMNHNTVGQVYGVMQKFGTRRARFFPAWRKNPYISILSPSQPDVLAAAWEREGKVLAVISNLQASREAEVGLRWLGPASPRVTDALTGQPVSMHKNRFEVRLPPENFALLWIEK
ncbi:MAG: hypothetical protein IT210_23785 [Armatimonadetes bacterium]|nr:hypothetical protein [Armatimonadota bacterium]